MKVVIISSLWLFCQLLMASESYKTNKGIDEGFKDERAYTFDKEITSQKYSTGLKFAKGWSKKVKKDKPSFRAVTLPRHFDWREQVKLSPIKDQGNCGSCWAFSTVATFQDVMIVKGSGVNNLSEQYLVSCNKDNWSCDGGWFAHDYHKSPLGAVLASYTPKVI